MLLSAEHISKNYGTKQLLHDVSLYLDEGQKIGIIGVNGVLEAITAAVLTCVICKVLFKIKKKHRI